MAVHNSLRSNKKALRKAIGTSLSALPALAVETQSHNITARVLSAPFFQGCKTVSCYMSITGEVDTTPIISEILRAGKTLFVPKIAEGRMDLLRAYDDDDLQTFPSGVWGIKEPPDDWKGIRRPTAREAEIDVILVPGVAFDRSLSRLGHGKGYYDRFLSSYATGERPPPLLVALALREQVLDPGKVPMGECDWKMNMIVTADGIIDTSQ